MRNRIAMVLAMGLGLLAAPLAAETPVMAPERQAVLGCLDGMGSTTSWGQCAGQLFRPCAGWAVGSAGHVDCLSAEHAGWLAAMDAQRLYLADRLTAAGTTELAQLMGQWFGYVSRKCADVAVGKAGSAAEAARLGCEISEFAGVTGEFLACAEARSTAPYCVMQD